MFRRRRTALVALAAVAVGVVAGSTGAARASSWGAYWNMNETSGTTMGDSSGNNNNGTLVGNVALGQPGFSGTAYGFDGSTSYVSVPDSGSLDPGSQDFSFTVHLNFPNVPTTDFDILRKGLSSTSGGSYKLEILKKKSGTIAIASCHYVGSSGASVGVNLNQDLHGNGWHTITCAKTSGSISVTVDGTTHSKSANVGSISNSSPLWLGAKLKGSTPKDKYLGLMDEVSLQSP